MTDVKLHRLIETANAVVRSHAGLRVNGKVASHRTQEYAEQVIGETCRRLHKLGFYLENIEGLSEKHIVTLIRSRDIDGYDGRRTGSHRARWVIRRESVFEFMNARRPTAKDLAPVAPRALAAPSVIPEPE